jgi:hypothetical protein
VPGSSRKKSKNLLIAFHQACDDNKPDVALRLLKALDLTVRNKTTAESVDREELMSALIVAHDRFWGLMHPVAESSNGRDTIH